MVEVPEPGAGRGFGLKVIPALRFDDRVTAALKPFCTAEIIMVVPEEP